MKSKSLWLSLTYIPTPIHPNGSLFKIVTQGVFGRDIWISLKDLLIFSSSLSSWVLIGGFKGEENLEARLGGFNEKSIKGAGFYYNFSSCFMYSSFGKSLQQIVDLMFLKGNLFLIFDGLKSS